MGSLRLRKLQWILESRPIKDVMRVSIFSERGILASLLQLIHVRATAGRWNVIIDRAMKYADWFVHDIKPPRKDGHFQAAESGALP